MRKLSNELITYFDSQIDPNSLGVIGLTPTELLMHVAEACVGVHEEGGDNQGSTVQLFQSVISAPQRQSWCMDFVQACIAYVEYRMNVGSPLAATELCLDLWNKSSRFRSVSEPKTGDIIIWQLGNTEHGHTGFIVKPATILNPLHQTIEGNTSDSSELNANGDGVYNKFRSKGGSVTFREMGFLRVFP